jgi:hypothetical protein
VLNGDVKAANGKRGSLVGRKFNSGKVIFNPFHQTDQGSVFFRR